MMGSSWTDGDGVSWGLLVDEAERRSERRAPGSALLADLEQTALDLERANDRVAELNHEADLLGDAWLKTLGYSFDLEHENHALRAEVARLKYELSRYGAAYRLGD